MLRSVQVRTVLVVPESPLHHLHWRGELALSLDCFICERIDRTTAFVQGAERAVCSGARGTGEHYTAARISVFDQTTERDRTTLRAIVDYWWSPFHDAIRVQPAHSLTHTPWVRHHLGYYCQQQEQAGEFSIQTNVLRPQSIDCQHCSTPIAQSHEPPELRLLT
ncbi:hypothetical protein JMF97_17590 [Micromonospora fiedleri]|uniref:Uncharacterized protein n=1 Tax=Micromonospora fiedleri TaxID=1157498 RepID=A0ABS1URM4_9ACTN|nr:MULTISPECIES: hypothetical protein [Micromonospora]MBL6277971.1 hypothetical protein [Micromonospora fiedleri]WSK41082.1 hypothetical protein OG712_21535 [Micromonospora maris]